MYSAELFLVVAQNELNPFVQSEASIVAPGRAVTNSALIGKSSYADPSALVKYKAKVFPLFKVVFQQISKSPLVNT